MSDWYAQNSSVNINSASEWNSNPAGGGTVLTWPPASGDNLYANGKNAISINVDFNIGTGKISAEAGAGTAGGYFGVTSTRSITCNINGSGLSTGTTVIISTNGNLTVTGNITSGPVQSTGIQLSATNSILVVNGTVTGGSVSNSVGVLNSAATAAGGGSMTFNGNVTGGSASNSVAITNNYNAPITVGNSAVVQGGSAASGIAQASTSGAITFNSGSSAIGGNGTSGVGVVVSATTGTTTINGDITGGSAATAYGISCSGAGRLIINGTVTAGSVAGCNGIASSSAASTLTINGNIIDTAYASACYVKGKLYFNPSSTNYHQAYNGSGSTTLYPTSSICDAKYIYAGQKAGPTTGTLHASNMHSGAGIAGVDLSAGILLSGNTVDDVAGSASGGGGVIVVEDD